MAFDAIWIHDADTESPHVPPFRALLLAPWAIDQPLQLEAISIDLPPAGPSVIARVCGFVL
jgi:hypothetical protein